MPSSKLASEPKLNSRLSLCRRITIAASRRSCQNASLGAPSEKFVVQRTGRLEFDAALDELAEHQKWVVESWGLPTKSHPIRLGQISGATAALLAAYDAPEKSVAETTVIDRVRCDGGVPSGKTRSPPRELVPVLSRRVTQLVAADLAYVRPFRVRRSLLPAVIIGVAVIGVAVATFGVRQPREQSFELASSPSHLTNGLSEGEPRLIAHESRGTSGEPIPLELTLRGTAHGGVVIIAGLVPGMTLSSGRALGTDAWQVPAMDLAGTWIGPPENFVGAVQLMAELQLPDATIVHRETIKIEWVVASPSGPLQGSSRGDAEQVTIMREPTSAKWQAIRHCWSIGQLVGSSATGTASCP